MKKTRKKIFHPPNQEKMLKKMGQVNKKKL